LRDILTRVGQTAIYVTHDQQEAFALADRVVILNAGRVAQIGTPQQVYRHPADAFVARFLGLTNLVRGQRSDAQKAASRQRIETALGTLALAEETCHAGEVVVLIWPDAAMLTGTDNLVEGTLTECSFRGGHTRIVVRANETNLEFEMGSNVTLPSVGSAIRLSLRPEAITCLPGL
jgi:ABC-type Fe3+/spermidine/putrescine transport system ATPase subunit